jgi:RHS repeat-associated protein
MTTRISRRALACALLTTTALASPAYAQQTQSVPPPPQFETFDGNGVDLATGNIVVRGPSISIGAAGSGLSFVRSFASNAVWDSTRGTLYQDTSTGIYTATLGTTSEAFTQANGVFTPKVPSGSTLTYNSTANTYTYTLADGTVVTFDGSTSADTGGNSGADVSSIVRPSGETLTYAYTTVPIQVSSYCDPSGCHPIYETFIRLQSIKSNLGYQLSIQHQADTASTTSDINAWMAPTKFTLFNLGADYCDPLANSCSPANPVQSISISASGYTDTAGRTSAYTYGSAGLTSVRLPGHATDDMTIGYDANGRVSSVTNEGVTSTYGYSDDTVNGVRTTTVTDAAQHQWIYKFALADLQPISKTDPLGRTASIAYNSSRLIQSITSPEGNHTDYGYDSRGNVTSVTNVAKAGSGLANIVTSAAYPSTCSTPKTCNEPTTTTDAKGNVTNYTYDANSGRVATITQPAPSTGAVRPQTRYTYSPLQAYYKNSTGSVVGSGQNIYELTATSACQTTASCSGTTDETKVTTSYGPQAAGTANNLLPISVTRSNGTGTLTATSSVAYDNLGNLLTHDGPLTGSADTTAYKYDLAREVIGIISPDPDGAGSLPNRALRLTYRPDSQLSKKELGTTAGQTDTAFNAMTVKETIDVTFDSNSRPTQHKLSSAGTAYTLTQSDYDSLGRLNCTAVRMNTAVYGSLPASACSLSTQGSFGPDRISQNVYDAASELTDVKVGVGTTDGATERHLAYSNNGYVTSLLDGENNLTTYVYDGFDRPSKIQHPSPTKGAGTSSAVDYEQLTYDANSNVTSRRLRDGTSIAFTYDNLNRATLKNLPGAEPDVTYGYDNLGRTTSANQTGNALTFGWDALSRKTSEAGPQGTTTFVYDAADEKTGITYSTNGGGSALTIAYAYLTTGDLSTIKQDTTALATYGYDSLGNRTSVTFANGASQAFTYDPVSRLSQLTNSLTDTNDLTATFAYNPANQITSTVRTGDMYAWTGHGSGSTAYVSNGLNEQTSIGAVNATWDSKGNITSEPQSGKTYGYSSENLLTSTLGGVTLAYDPAMRLYQTAGAATTRFAYDGSDAIAEYDGANTLQRRFVFDPTTDQPAIWFEGTGVASTNRRYLSRDERGSVISVSGSTGASLGINTYDEYGKPGSANIGRYQYTGQKWIPEAGIYDYKARDYIPQLGIFAQTDPIGYRDGSNWYAGMHNDPVNATDPAGLAAVNPTGNFYCNDCTGIVGYTAMDLLGDAPTPPDSSVPPNEEESTANLIWQRSSSQSTSSSENILTGSLSVYFTPTILDTGLHVGDSLVRTWEPTPDLGTGIVVQQVSSLLARPDGTFQANSFYEAWPEVNGSWPYGNTDFFGFVQGSSGESLTVSAEAYYYPGVAYDPYYGVSSVLVPGAVTQAGGLPSCYCQMNPLFGRSAIGPVSVTFTTTVP